MRYLLVLLFAHAAPVSMILVHELLLNRSLPLQVMLCLAILAHMLLAQLFQEIPMFRAVCRIGPSSLLPAAFMPVQAANAYNSPPAADQPHLNADLGHIFRDPLHQPFGIHGPAIKHAHIGYCLRQIFQCIGMDGRHTPGMPACARSDINVGILIPDFRVDNPLGRLTKGQLERLWSTVQNIFLIRLIFHDILIRKVPAELISSRFSMVMIRSSSGRAAIKDLIKCVFPELVGPIMTTLNRDARI